MQQLSAGPPGKISGHVYRADTGEPLARAVVRLLPSGSRNQPAPAPQSTRTGADGAFLFAVVNPGNYTVLAEHAGFVSEFYGEREPGGAAQPIKLASGENHEKADILLVAAGVISGTVYDEENEPIEAIDVTVIRVAYMRGGQKVEISVRNTFTDDLGNYRLYGLSPGTYFVRTVAVNGRTLFSNQESDQAYRQTYYPGVATIEGAQRIKVGAGAEVSSVRFSVILQSTYSISGTIIDTAGGPGPRRYAIVVGHSLDEGSWNSVGNVSVNNSDGSFVVRGVPSGNYTVTAHEIQGMPPRDLAGPVNAGSIRVTEFGSAEVRVADADAHVNIQVGHPGEIHGKATLENSPGQSLTPRRIALQSQSPAGGDNFNLTSALDSSSSFSFQNVMPGSYVLSLAGPQDMYLKQAVCGGKDYTYQPVVMVPGSVLGDCVLTIAKDSSVISGQVMDGDKPAADLIVVAIPQSPFLRKIPRYTMAGNSDAAGQFKISGVVPGDYVLFALPRDDEQSYFALDFADQHQRDLEAVTVRAGETKTVNLKPTKAQ